MDFPIIDLVDSQRSIDWLEQHFHPEGQRCPHCGASREDSRGCRLTQRSEIAVYRCRRCDGVYNVYSGTLFSGSGLSAPQVVLLLQGVLQGKSSRQLGRELGLTETTILLWRHRLQALQPKTALPDLNTETDEMFQNSGKKEANTPTPLTHRASEPINGADGELLPMTAPRF